MSEWKSPTEAPDVPRGHARCFIVAVRRKHDGNVYVFPACYLNAMPLIFDDDRQGDMESDPDDEGMRRTTGWYQERDHADYDTAYYEMLGGADSAGDELVGWQPLPKWTEGHQQECGK